MSGLGTLQFGATLSEGRYSLMKSLGRGGMGQVWLARDQRLGELVAVKFLPSELRADPSALDELRRETARSRMLTHPNIVRVHELQEDASGLVFITMEYVDGSTLAALRLSQPNRVLKWEFLSPLVQQLCAALDYAHGEDVIHRDLKPANLLVDREERLKLADFGIAVSTRDDPRIHSTSGTLPYMSPQQLQGQPPRPTDDIYALGATLYELLTSRPPFDTGDVVRQVLSETPEALDQRLAALGITNAIPPEVATTIMACLSKDPALRPQNSIAIAEDLGLQTKLSPSTDTLAKALFTGPSDNSEDGAIAESGPGFRGAAYQILSERSAKKFAAFKRMRSRRFFLTGGVLLSAGVIVWSVNKIWPPDVNHYIDLEPLANARFEQLRILPAGLADALAPRGKEDWPKDAVRIIHWVKGLSSGTNAPSAVRKGLFQATNGVTFSLRSTVATESRAENQRPSSVAFDVHIRCPSSVHLLINATDLQTNWAGSAVGEVELRFADGSQLVFPLVAWETVRETWQYDKSARSIPPPRDPSVSLHEVYADRSYSRGGATVVAVIDMLSLRLPPEYRLKTLITIRLTDVSWRSVNSADPGLLLMGITVKAPKARD